MRRTVQVIVAFWVLVALSTPALAQDDGIDRSPENLMVVLRPSTGANKPDFGLEPMGTIAATLPSGEEVLMEPAWFHLVADVHVRFVFDGERTMANVTAKELAGLGLSPDEALDLATANIRRVYGRPRLEEWVEGLMVLDGQSPDLLSSYFLDDAFWRGLAKRYPEGLAVGVPTRGGLVLTPMSNETGVQLLKEAIGGLYQNGEAMRVSSALYLFKDDTWSLLKAPLASP